MPILAGRLESITAVLTALGAVAVLFSIAASQALFGLALICLLVFRLISRRSLEFPPRLRWPLLGFIVWTLLSLAFSYAPLTGFSQARKLVLFLILLLVYNAYQSRRDIERTFQGLLLGGAIASLYGVGQFLRDYLTLKRAGLPFYENYVTHQISGFMSHWMTFGGELMLVLVLLFVLLLFLRSGEVSRWWWLCVAPLGMALLGSFTRGIWLGALAGLTYLLARSRRPILCVLLPAGVLLLYLLAPRWLQQRERSIFDVETDSSNRARIVMLHTGLAMISAHPIFSVGPERVGPEFLLYKPSSLPLAPGWYGHLHSDYLQIAAERGIPCLLLLLWLFFEILRQGILLGRNRAEEIRAMGHAAVALTAALMVAGLFEYNFGDSEVLMLYLFLMAAVFSWPRLQNAEDAEPGKPGHGFSRAERVGNVSGLEPNTVSRERGRLARKPFHRKKAKRPRPRSQDKQ